MIPPQNTERTVPHFAEANLFQFPAGDRVGALGKMTGCVNDGAN